MKIAVFEFELTTFHLVVVVLHLNHRATNTTDVCGTVAEKESNNLSSIILS